MYVAEAIKQHGAAAVYAAAHRHAAGDAVRGLRTVGLQATSMRDVWDIISTAYALMSDAERAIENASASSDLEHRHRG